MFPPASPPALRPWCFGSVPIVQRRTSFLHRIVAALSGPVPGMLNLRLRRQPSREGQICGDVNGLTISRGGLADFLRADLAHSENGCFSVGRESLSCHSGYILADYSGGVKYIGRYSELRPRIDEGHELECDHQRQQDCKRDPERHGPLESAVEADIAGRGAWVFAGHGIPAAVAPCGMDLNLLIAEQRHIARYR